MDDADKADDIIESHLRNSLKRITTIKPAYSGVCLFCEEDCGQSRYCDRYCREQHEKQQRRNR